MNRIQYLIFILLLFGIACQEESKPRLDTQACSTESIEITAANALKQDLIQSSHIKTLKISKNDRVVEQIDFDEEGRTKQHLWQDSSGKESVREEYLYDENTKLLQSTKRFHQKKDYATSSFYYDTQGRLLKKETTTDKRKVYHSYAYNEHCLTKVQNEIFDLLAEDKKIYSAYHTYQYNSLGQCLLKEWYLSNDSLHAQWLYRYNEDGLLKGFKMLNAKNQDQRAAEFIYEDDKLLVHNTNRGQIVYTYNATGLPMEKKTILPNKTTYLETYHYEYW